MFGSVLLCLVSFGILVHLQRARGSCLGLTLGYFYLLLLIHVPGAIAHMLPWSRLPDLEATAMGIRLTAFGCMAYVAGVWLSKIRQRKVPIVAELAPPRFLTFCVIGGWIATFLVRTLLLKVPSLWALVDEGGMIWMLGVMLGLAKALRGNQRRALIAWLGVLSVYPAIVLVKDGFLSFGMNAAIMCLAPLILVARRGWQAWCGIIILTVAGLGLFATYFSFRQELRKVVWGKQDVEERLAESGRLFSEFRMFDAQDKDVLTNVNDRLNQNYFVGMAHNRLARGIVDYYRGRTVVEGFMAVIPRVLWPEKPVYGGSPAIIETMTGFKVRKGVSYGVGNVMEFYINFGLPSLIGGFLVVGWFLGWLDASAARALAIGDLKGVILRVLPAISFIQPDKSVVEMMGGSAAALLAAWIWCRLWDLSSGGQGRVTTRWEPRERVAPAKVAQAPRPRTIEAKPNEHGTSDTGRDLGEGTERDDFRF